jgi:hypothetical protein
MRRTLGCIALALALVLLPAAFAQDKKPGADKPPPADKDKKPDADKDAPKEKKEAADKLVIAGEITGKLTRWEGVDKPFTVQVTLNYNAPDPNAVKQLADLEAKYQVALLKKDVKGALDLRNQMAGVKLYQPKKEDLNIDFEAAPDFKVRIIYPLVYDDKGNPKKLTRKELDEAKGPDKKLPGYTAEPGDVHQDSIVTVYLAKKKPAKPAAKDDKAMANPKLEALMILIRAEPPPPK